MTFKDQLAITLYNLNLVLGDRTQTVDVIGVFADGASVRACGSPDHAANPMDQWTPLADATAVDDYLASVAADPTSLLVRSVGLHLRKKG